MKRFTKLIGLAALTVVIAAAVKFLHVQVLPNQTVVTCRFGYPANSQNQSQ